MSDRVETQARLSPQDYLLANDSSEAPRRFAALTELFDSGTVHHLDKCGVSRGWACLEAGGGGRSIARWLADRLGPTGHVLVTDIDTRYLEPLINLELRCAAKYRHRSAPGDSFRPGVYLPGADASSAA